MRNLKKFLALVLAMVMAFSLMLTANAANPVKDFDDAGSITKEFQEAADVLTGMKVFQGDEEAPTFRPGDTINRAEVAALIYRLATGDVDDVRAGAYANYGNFADVNESDWFAGYVGYCANAGYIKGHDGYFNPYDSVTGYETLAMILRAIGYDKNNEFTGATWETNVSALATQLGILTNIKTTHYGNTLYLASRRDVVAELLFQAVAEVPMVVYTPAFGYQQTGMDGGVVGTTENPTLGWHIFGLVDTTGMIIGNQQTGEKNTRLGYSSTDVGGTEYYASAGDRTSGIVSYQPFSAYAWENATSATNGYEADGVTTYKVPIGYNRIFNVETGIELFGHKTKIWCDGRGSSYDSTKGYPVYAYFDKAEATDVVYADNTILNAAGGAGTTNLKDAIDASELSVNSSKTAVFSNSFGKFGTLDTPTNVNPAGDTTDADETKLSTGDGVSVNGATNTDQYASPVGLYKIISNNKNKTVDAVIALNIESAQVTEATTVNRVPTIGVPVMNWSADDTAANGSYFVEGAKGSVNSAGAKDDNLKDVGGTAAGTGVLTGVLAQAALVGNSTKTLGDYEMGIHITGTTRRNVSDDEATAINLNKAAKDNLESSYFLLNKVNATVEGKVVAYNTKAGTVTLDNGTVLERSKFYDTVVITNPKNGSAANKVSANVAPVSAIPQAWLFDSSATTDAVTDQWVEGYANVTYKFYTDYEGKYLGAERSFGSTFLYGTYLDYEQKLSTSTFSYYMTGVNLNGEIETIPVTSYWNSANITATTGLEPITGTNLLGIPYRDTYSAAASSMNGIGEGVYTGFAVTGTTVDSMIKDDSTNRNEYLNNIARLGVKNGAYLSSDGTTANPDFTAAIDIDNNATTVGAKVTVANGSRYFTEATKFILVEGYGTDSVKAEVYTGISELKGNAAHVFLNMAYTVDNTGTGANFTSTEVRLPHITGDSTGAAGDGTAMNVMTYYTESPYTYAQSGDTAMKIDTIILPKAAVSWSGGSGLYFVGNPTPSLTNSWGIDAWKYDLYEDGELKQVWLTNNPSQAAANQDDTQLTKDSFMNLKETGEVANDGQPIYTAGMYDLTGAWSAGKYFDNTTAVADGGAGTPVYDTTTYLPNLGYVMNNTYSAVTRDAQTATFSGDGTHNILLRVAGAKVVNLNKDAKSDGAGTFGNATDCQSGEIWPGITDLTTLNEAGSINPVTSRALKVAAVVDPSNPLIVTCIYVCWEQDFS